MYLTATRPDIMHAVSLLSRYMHCASEIHFTAAKRILRYIKGTADYGIKFSQVGEFNLHGYTDSDWAGNMDDMRSSSDTNLLMILQRRQSVFVIVAAENKIIYSISMHLFIHRSKNRIARYSPRESDFLILEEK